MNMSQRTKEKIMGTPMNLCVTYLSAQPHIRFQFFHPIWINDSPLIGICSTSLQFQQWSSQASDAPKNIIAPLP